MVKPSHPGNRHVRLLMLIVAVAAAIGAVVTPDVHGRALALIAPQAADADYIHQIDTIDASMAAVAALPPARLSASAVESTRRSLAGQQAALDRIEAAGQVPAEFRLSDTALRTAITALAGVYATPGNTAILDGYRRAVAEFTGDYQRALRDLDLPPGRG